MLGGGVQVVALLRERRARVRLHRAAGPRHWVAFVDRWSELYDAIRSMPVALVVLDPRLDGTVQEEAVERLLRHHPSIAIVLYLPFGPDLAAPLLRWARRGVRHIVFLDLGDSTLYLQDLLDRALARSATEALWNRLSAALGPLAAETGRPLRVALHRIAEIGSAEEWAEALGLPVRSFYRCFRRGGLPAPKRCLEWLRLLYAAHRMRDPGFAHAEVIAQLRWAPSRRFLAEAVGGSDPDPSELWYTVSFDDVLQRFVRECREGARARLATRKAVT